MKHTLSLASFLTGRHCCQGDCLRSTRGYYVGIFGGEVKGVARAEVIRGEVPSWAGDVADGLDERGKEYHRIEGRSPFLWLALLVFVSATVHLVRGRDADLRRNFGESADVLPLGAPLAAAWLFRDHRRRKAMARENRIAYAQLEDAGFSYNSYSLDGPRESRVERLPDRA